MSNQLKHNLKKPVLLCILDGWGIGVESPNNAILAAKIPNYQAMLEQFPNCEIATSGLDVGLPVGQMGNSEVGHTCIGAGRIIFQDLPRINNSIDSGDLLENQHLRNLILACQNSNQVCHLLGLLSDGGVHCHINHIIFLAKTLAKNGIKVKLHCFLDGRDVAQKSAKIYLQNLLEEIKEYPKIKIASVAGRYYAMDRDNNWQRINLSYQAIVEGCNAKKLQKFVNPINAVENCYQNNISDEFIVPLVAKNYYGMNDGDALLMVNFRADRVRQLASALVDPEFFNLPIKQKKFCFTASMTEYSEELNLHLATLFPAIKIDNSLGEIFSKLGLKQLRIAETEKYAHITFFFSGGREQNFLGEDRILVKSPDVATYDLLPQMSALEVGDKLKQAINSDLYDFIVVNYANPDMVGHSGVLSASIKACETIDQQLEMLKNLILEKNGIMLICADHGNVENMVDDFGNPHTSHTTNPVPLILISNDLQDIKLENGRLCDIAPTILSLMNIDQPAEMTGRNLIITK